MITSFWILNIHNRLLMSFHIAAEKFKTWNINLKEKYRLRYNVEWSGRSLPTFRTEVLSQSSGKESKVIVCSVYSSTLKRPRQYVSSKCRQTFTRLKGIISQRILHFMVTAEKTSNRTWILGFSRRSVFSVEYCKWLVSCLRRALSHVEVRTFQRLENLRETLCYAYWYCRPVELLIRKSLNRTERQEHCVSNVPYNCNEFGRIFRRLFFFTVVCSYSTVLMTHYMHQSWFLQPERKRPDVLVHSFPTH
jgi:hypothetical protein